MSDRYLAEPDLEFIKEIQALGGDSLKKCFQCATCSVACPISPDKKPFPRKEMIAASWGLKDKLVGNLDIWLCHECGDCSEKCPRDARPGDVLSAIRAKAISEYATPRGLGKIVNSPKGLPILLAIPAIWFAIMAAITMKGGEAMNTLFQKLSEFPLLGFLDWYHTHDGLPPHGIVHAKFVSTWLIDFTFVPVACIVAFIFIKGLISFLTDIHENAVREGKIEKKDFKVTDVFTPDFIRALVGVIITILKHEKFSECTENNERATSHMMVLYGFIGCAIVTGVCVILLYLFHIPGPYSLFNPLKWLANVAGISIVIGSLLLIKNRLSKVDGKTSYKDWYLLGLVFGVGLSGMLTEMLRLGGMEFLTYATYYIHLIIIFNLFAFLPFSKMAHFVYRTVAMTYAEYARR